MAATTVSARPWLPDEVLGRGIAERLLAGAFDLWSAHWFPRRGPRPGRLAVDWAGAEPADAGRALWLGEGLAVEVEPGATALIAALMLDVPAVDEKTLLAADRAILGNLAEACLDDLCRRLASLFGCAADPRLRLTRAERGAERDRFRSCPVATADGKPLLRLAVGEDLLVSLTRSSFAPGDKAELRPVAEGLAQQPVQFSARLGRARLTLAEFAALSDGDVLVLDHPLAHPVSPAIDGQAKEGGCTIDEEDGRLFLKICEPLSR